MLLYSLWGIIASFIEEVLLRSKCFELSLVRVHLREAPTRKSSLTLNFCKTALTCLRNFFPAFVKQAKVPKKFEFWSDPLLF